MVTEKNPPLQLLKEYQQTITKNFTKNITQRYCKAPFHKMFKVILVKSTKERTKAEMIVQGQDPK